VAGFFMSYFDSAQYDNEDYEYDNEDYEYDNEDYFRHEIVTLSGVEG
jgi:hypothetical protein